MRIDLILQRNHARLKQQSFLLFQLDLNSDAVINLQLRTHHHDGRQVNSAFHPEIRMFQAEDRSRPESPQFRLQKPQSNDGEKKCDLPIEQSRDRQVAANPVIDTQIDEWRERPDIFFIRSHVPQLPGDQPAEDIEGQRRPFAMQSCRKRNQRAPHATRQTPAKHAEQHGGF